VTRTARAFFFTAAALSGTAVLVLALLVIGVTTPLGPRVATTLAERFLDGLSIESYSGTFSSAIVLQGVSYENDTVDAHLDSVTIDPSLGELFDARYAIEQLVVRGGSVTLAASEPAAQPANTDPLPPPQIPSLPDSVAVHLIRVEQFRVQAAGNPYVIAELSGSLAGDDVALDTLAVRGNGFALDTAGTLTLGDDIRATLHGLLALGEEPESAAQAIGFAADIALVTNIDPWYARVSWTQLDWRGSPIGDLSSPEGSWIARLGAAPIPTELNARIEGDELPASATIEAVGTVTNFDTIAIERLHVDAPGGAVTAEGRVALASRSGGVMLTVESLDPSMLDARLEGALRGHLDITFETEPALRASVNGMASGVLGGKEFDATVAAKYDDGSLDIASAYVEAGDGRLELSGSATRESVDLRFDANVPELAAWYPPAAGSIDARGSIRGDARDPAVDASLAASALTLESVPVAIARLSLAMGGTLADHEISLEADTDRGRFSARVEQSLREDTVTGRLLATSFEIERAGSWTLAAPTSYVASTSEMSIERTCFAGPQAARACVRADRLSATFDAERLPAALADPWLPDGVEASGAADFEAQIEWDGAPTGSFSFRQPSLVLRQATLPEAAAGNATPARAAARTEIAGIEVAGALTENDLVANLTATLPEAGGKLDGRLEIAPPGASGALSAVVNANVPDLMAISALSDDVEDLTGSLEASLTAGGTPAAPQFQGEVALEGVRASVSRLGVELTNGRLTAIASSLDAVRFDGELCSGGCVMLDGTLDLAPRGWQLAATVDGRGFEVANRPDLRATIAPDLLIGANQEQWLVTGELGVDEGLVIVDSVPRSAVRPASETVVHGRAESEEPAKGSAPFAMQIDVALADARFEGLGIIAELDGTLDVEQTSDGRLLVNGTTNVAEGTFGAYGQTLEIERGQLIFTGSPANPSLDLRASREVEGATVGLDITGTAQDPRSEVFSNPALSDSEAFARLVTGRSLAGAGAAADPEALERAAIGLGLRRALPTLDRIGANLGLDELGVDSGGDSQGALVAGKQLGEDVYLRYKHGLFDDFSGLQLIYRLTQRLRLRTETGTQQSIDLVYETGGRGEPQDISESDAFDLDQGRSADEVATPN
jgi:autotransporter translocation and assembly factor TamB